MDKRLFTVVKKELKRIFTDRRLVFTTMILPAVSIFIMYSFMGNMIDTKINDVEGNIPKVTVMDAPESFKNFSVDNDLSDFMTLTFVALSDKETYKDQILDGNLELFLVFESNFDEMVDSIKHPNVERYYNGVEDYSSEARWNMDNVLEEYEMLLLGERIGNPDHVDVFDLNRGVENASLQDEQKATGKGLATLFPTLIAIFLFSGAMSVGPDMIAGEKERGTMATLLVTPVKRETLAMGKVIALAVVAIVSSLSSFIGIIASMPAAGSMFADDGIDMSSLKFSVSEFASLAAVMITLVGVYVAVVCLVSIIAKSIKEANTYMAPIYMVVMVSGFSLMFSDGPVATWKFAIPVYGSILTLKQLFTFELTSNMVLYSCGVSVILTGIMVYTIKVLFNNERVMFSK